MTTYIGHLEHATALTFGLLASLCSRNDPDDEFRSTARTAVAKRVDNPIGGEQDGIYGESIDAVSNLVTDLYGVSLGEHDNSQSLYAAVEPLADEKGPSPLVSWLYIVRYSLSLGLRDNRPDLTLSHSFNAAKAQAIGVGSTFVVRRWKRDRGDPDLAIKTIRLCKREEENELLAAVGLEMKALTHQSLVGNEFVVQLEAVDWEVRAQYEHPLPILITECADFGDLASYQRQPLTLTFETKLQLCLDVALGIRLLHAHGFIHGDIKSENVLLFRHPERGYIAKLSDFAFSILPTHRGEKRRFPGKSFPYNAPEIDGNKETAALDFKGCTLADIYSLGMLVWRVMLDGQNPFAVDTSPRRPNHSVLTDEIIRRKQDQKLVEEACESIRLFGKGIKTDVVRQVLLVTLQVQPGGRNIASAISLMASTCGRTESVAQLPHLNLQYRPPRNPVVDLYQVSQKDDNLLLTAMETNPCVSMPVFLTFHPVDKMHSAVQRHILLVLEELATGQSDASIIVKLLLAFIYLCGFGHASPQNDVDKISQHLLGAASATIKRLLTEGTEEDKAKAVLFTLTGAVWDILPLEDASTFFLRLLDTLTNGKESKNMVGYKGGLIRNAEDGSPIAKQLLQEYLPAVLERLEDRAYLHALEEEHADLLEAPRHASPELEQVIERHPDVAWSMLQIQYPGLDMVAYGGNTFLHVAAQHGYTLVVQDLLEKIPHVDFVNLHNYHQETPLFKAAKGGHQDICRILLEAGSEVKENLFNETALHWVSTISEADDIEFLVRQYVDRGADIAKYAGPVSALTMNTHAKAGTPLERAVSRNNPVAVRCILDVGANPDLVTDKALHTAAMYHFSECLQILLDERPKFDSVMNHRNLLGSAILGAPKWQWYHWHGPSYQQAAIETLEIILDAGTDTRKVVTYMPFSQRFDSQFSAMGAAAAVGADYMIDTLAAHGISVEVQLDANYGQDSPPLYEAMSRGYYGAAKALLHHHANPNVRWLMVGGDTYLHMCAYYHWDLRFARLLIEDYHADTNIVDYRGRTPLYTALLAENFEFADYLLERGSSPTGWPTNAPGNKIGYNLFGELLALGTNISDRQLEYALKLSGGKFQVTLSRDFEITALHIACSPYLLSTGRVQHVQPLRDAYSRMEERRIVEFVLSKFPGASSINATTSDGATALHLAAVSGHVEAARTLLETGAVKELNVREAFNAVMAILFSQTAEEVMIAGRKVRYREGIKEMLQLLRSHLPRNEALKLPLNAYTKRLAAVRREHPAETLPTRRRYISARRYCSLPTYPAVRTFFLSEPKQADPDSFLTYVDGIIAALSLVMPMTWILGKTPVDDEPTDAMFWRVRRVLWDTLDVDWVLFVQDKDGRGFRSPSERLQVLEDALRLLLHKVFDVKLKLAGNGKMIELLFLIERKGEIEDPEELCESQFCTWMPTFEEGRDYAQLSEWEGFLRELRMESEASQRGFMVVTESEEPDAVWEREVTRIKGYESRRFRTQ